MLKADARALLWWSSTAWLGRLEATPFHSLPSTTENDPCASRRASAHPPKPPAGTTGSGGSGDMQPELPQLMQVLDTLLIRHLFYV